MSEDEFQRIGIAADVARRRRWSAERKLRILKESFLPGETVSVVARRYGVAPTFCSDGAA